MSERRQLQQSQLQPIHVFLSSPGDVADERGLAHKVAAELSAGHCQVVRHRAEIARATERIGDHAAIWTQLSCRQTRKVSARAPRYRAAAIRCRRGRKCP